MAIKTIRQRFKSSIRRGTGEAYLIMLSNPKVDFSSDIIKAALTNYSYDGQSEGNRALYVSELITLSKQQNKIRNAILNGLAIERQDTWSLNQLFELAAIFAQQGDREARQAIYKRFFKKIINGSDWCGYACIIKLDGLEGLKYIASTIGKALKKNPNDWQDDWIIRHFQDMHPKIKAMSELEKATKENHFIKIYLDNVERTVKNRENHQQPVFNLDTLREIIAKSKYILIPPSFTKSLSEAEVKVIADELLVEKDKKRLGKYLSIFSRIKFPYGYEPLMKFAKTKVNNSDRIVEWAVESLKHFSGSEIREFALSKLKTFSSPSTYLNLLINNYKTGDAKLLKKIADRSKSEHDVHHLVFSYVAIYKTNKTKECKEPLESIYNKLTCGIHRKDIVEILLDNGVISNKIKQEIKHDSYGKTRKLI